MCWLPRPAQERQGNCSKHTLTQNSYLYAKDIDDEATNFYLRLPPVDTSAPSPSPSSPPTQPLPSCLGTCSVVDFVYVGSNSCNYGTNTCTLGFNYYNKVIIKDNSCNSLSDAATGSAIVYGTCGYLIVWEWKG